MAVLSYVQAPLLWRRPEAPRASAFFDSFGPFQAIALHLPGGNAAVIVSYWVPLVLASLSVLLLVLMLGRHAELADPRLARMLFRWSLAFAAACSFAFPVFTQDFWLSAAWGRMIASGLNPYHSLFGPESLAGLPLDHFPMAMSYGPLWGVLSGAVMAIAKDSVLAATIIFKAVLAAAWVGSLVLIDQIMKQRLHRDRCLAIAVFGWTPLGVTQTLAEGHNDIAMTSLALLWLFLLLRGSGTAPIALVASVLCKYVTAPLFLVDALYAVRVQRVGWRNYIVRLILPTLVGLSVFTLFYRSPQFFDGLRAINTWHFLQPRDAVAAIEYLAGTSLSLLKFGVVVLFPVLSVYWLVVFFRRPTIEAALASAVAILATISFTMISHLWPWYLTWTLAFAALLPRWWLSRFVVGVTVAAPFALAMWWIAPRAHYMGMAALAVYVGAVLWMLSTHWVSCVPANGRAASGERAIES